MYAVIKQLLTVALLTRRVILVENSGNGNSQVLDKFMVELNLLWVFRPGEA